MTPKTIFHMAIAATTTALVAYSAALLLADEPPPLASDEANQERRVQQPADDHRATARRGTGPRPFPRRPALNPEPIMGDESDAPPTIEEDLQQTLAYETARETEFMAKFDSESVDGSWAARWEPALTTTLESALAQQSGLSNLTVECRSERCLAHTEWTDYSSALRAVGAAADATGGVCATSVFVPPPEDRSAPYRHAVRFSSCQDNEPLLTAAAMPAEPAD